MKTRVMRLIVAVLLVTLVVPANLGATDAAIVGATQTSDTDTGTAGQPLPPQEPAPATEPPAPAATEPPPVVPTEIPPTQVIPTTVPPTAVPPTPTPTTVPPTAVPPTPTIPATVPPTPSPTATATAAPSPTPSPTAEPRFSAQAETLTLTTTPAGSAAIGASVTAQAGGLDVSVANLGTMTYTYWLSATCSGSPFNAGVKQVTVLGIPPSDAVFINSAGPRSFQASYSGDLVNPAGTSPCVAVAVGKASPTIAITVGSGTYTAGGNGTATASLSGGYQRTGTVTYRIYNNAACSGTANTTSANLALVSGNAPASGNLLLDRTGAGAATALYFQVTYNGDANNNPAVSACTAKTVNKKTVTVTMTLPKSTYAANEPIAGDAAMTGFVFNAGGTVSYYASTSGTCTNNTVLTPPGSSVKTVTNGDLPAADPLVVPNSSAIRYKAVYSGDDNNLTARVCVTIAITRVTPTIGTSVSPNPVAVNASTTASATITGAAGTPSGTATYAVFSNATCTTGVTSTMNGSKTLSGGAIPNSTAATFATAGTYYVRVTYNGNSGNNAASSPCTAFRVLPASTITLGVSPTSVQNGNPVTVSSTLAGGATATAGGSVLYQIYANSACTTALTPPVSATVTVTNRTVPPATLTAPSQTGTVYVRATYSGDADNTGAVSTCTALTITTRASTIAVAPSPASVTVGSTLQSVATLGNLTATAGGTVTYRRFSNAICSTQVGTDNVKTVSNGIVAASDSFTATAAGTLYIRAVYSGDPLNAAATSACALVTVAKKATTTISIQTPGAVEIGNPFTLTGTVGGAYGTPTGTMTLRIYSDSACTAAVAGHTYTLTLSGTSATTGAITYSFGSPVWYDASYDGDTNNLLSRSTCKRVQVATGSLTASITGGDLPPVMYANTAQQTTGTLTVTVSDLRGTGAGWTVSVQSNGFVYTGSAVGGGAIPTDNLVLTGTGSPTVVSGQPVGAGGPTATNSTGSLGAPRAILVAGNGYGSGVYTQILTIQLTIPGGTPSGTYTSEVTVTTAAAP